MKENENAIGCRRLVYISWIIRTPRREATPCVEGESEGSGNFLGSNTTSSRSEVLLHYGRLRDQLCSPLLHSGLSSRYIRLESRSPLRASRNLAGKKILVGGFVEKSRKSRGEFSSFRHPPSLFLPRYTIDFSICRKGMIHYTVFCGIAVEFKSAWPVLQFLQFRATLINQSLHSEYYNILDSSERGEGGQRRTSRAIISQKCQRQGTTVRG